MPSRKAGPFQAVDRPGHRRLRYVEVLGKPTNRLGLIRRLTHKQHGHLSKA